MRSRATERASKDSDPVLWWGPGVGTARRRPQHSTKAEQALEREVGEALAPGGEGRRGRAAVHWAT